MINKLRIAGLVAVFGLLAACSEEVKRKPGSIYMPDMANSRAYETYADHSNLAANGINYNNMPVPGTVSRSQDYVYHLAVDKAGDSTNYAASSSIPNPVTLLSATQLQEAKRLYLVNCAICHGSKLDGNGPLWKDGTGPYPAAPKSLIGDELKAMSEGKMFYSVTYGKNLMGPYGSQLTPKQRWEIIHYIKVEQGVKENPTEGGTTDSTATKVSDTLAVAIK